MSQLTIVLLLITVCTIYANIQHQHEERHQSEHQHVEVGISQHNHEQARHDQHNKNIRQSRHQKEVNHNGLEKGAPLDIYQKEARHNEHVRNEQHYHNSRHNHHGFRHGKFHSKHIKARCGENACDEKNTTDTGSEGSPYVLYYNSTASLLAFSSPSMLVSLVIDYNSGTILSLNGKSTESVLICPEMNLAALQDKSSHLVWSSSNQNFESFFASIDSSDLKSTLQPGNKIGHSNNINDAPQEVLKEVSDVLENLGQKDASSASISYILALSKRITSQKGVLNVIIDGSGKVATHLRLVELVCVLEGLEKVIANLESNSLQVPKLDLSKILLASNGFEAFLNILKQLGRNIDLSRAIGNGLYTIENFLSFAVKFSGDSSNGVDGIIRIIHSLVAFVSNHSSGSDVVQSFLQFFTNNGINFDRRQIVGLIRGFISIFASQSTLYPNVPGCNILLNFLENLEHGTFVLNGINISSIINNLIHLKPQNALRAYISILVQLGIGVPELFFQMIRLLTTPAGVDALTTIVPGLDKSQIPTNGNPLQFILRNSNLTQAISSGCSPTRAIQAVPVIGTIFTALSNSSNVTTDFTKLFSSSPGLNTFLNFLQGMSSGNGLGGFLSVFAPLGLSNILGGNTFSSQSPSPIATTIPDVTGFATDESPITSTTQRDILFTNVPQANETNGILGGLLGRNNKLQAKHLKKEMKVH